LSAPRSDYWYRKSLDALLHAEESTSSTTRRFASRMRRTASDCQIRLDSLVPGTGPHVSPPLGTAPGLEALAFGRTLRPDPEFSEEMAAAWRALGDPQQAAIALIEGLAIDSSHTQFASELVDLYQRTEPQSCAIRNVAGSVSLNLDCPWCTANSARPPATWRCSTIKKARILWPPAPCAAPSPIWAAPRNYSAKLNAIGPW